MMYCGVLIFVNNSLIYFLLLIASITIFIPLLSAEKKQCLISERKATLPLVQNLQPAVDF